MLLFNDFLLLSPPGDPWPAGLYGLDAAALEYLNGSRITHLDFLLQLVTLTAYGLGALVPVGLYAAGHLKRLVWFKLRAFQFAGAMGLNVLLVATLKYAVDRPRPFVAGHAVVQLAEAASPSFPSGHTAFAFTAAVALILMFPHRWLRLLVLAWALLVAYSRLALGVHYPSDVLASVLIGSASAVLAGYAFRQHRTRVFALLREARRLSPKDRRPS